MSAVRNLAYDPDREVRRPRLRGRAGGLGARGRAAGRGAQQHQGRGQHAQRAAAAGSRRWTPRCFDATTSTARRSTRCWRPRASRSPTSAAICAPRRARSGVPHAGRGTTCSRRSAPAARALGLTPRPRDFIVEQFGTLFARLSDFAARAFREHWIDAEPRPGKRDGAFCMSLRGDESRILANFKPAFDGMSTLAHELGHGYHNLNLAAAHHAAAQHADDPGRDGEHLLRDDRPRTRRWQHADAAGADWRSWRRRCRAPARWWSTSPAASSSSSAVFERRRAARALGRRAERR